MELASGVDALYLSGRASVPESFLNQLEELRGAAVASGKPVALGLDGETFHVQGRAWGKYRYCMTHRHGQIGVTASRSLPPVRVQPRTEFLHGVAPLPAVTWFEEKLWSAVGPIRFSVSRLDLHADWQGWDVDGDDRSRFVCRAERRDLHEHGERLSGFEFGRRGTGTVCGRIYDKSAEQRAKGSDFWLDIWGAMHDESRPVLRVEFEFGKQGLREYDVDTPEEAVEAAGALWASVTTDWLTYRSPTSDSTKSRWPVAPEWLDIQRASIRGDAAGLQRMYDGKRAGALRTLMPLLNGCMVSFASLVGADTIDEARYLLAGYLRDYEVLTSRSFSSRVADKRREMDAV